MHDNDCAIIIITIYFENLSLLLYIRWVGRSPAPRVDNKYSVTVYDTKVTISTPSGPITIGYYSCLSMSKCLVT